MSNHCIGTTLLSTRSCSKTSLSSRIDPNDPNGPGAYAIQWVRRSTQQQQQQQQTELEESSPPLTTTFVEADVTILPITENQRNTVLMSMEQRNFVEADNNNNNNNNNNNRIPTIEPLSIEQESITVTEHYKNKQRIQKYHVIFIIVIIIAIAVIGGSIGVIKFKMNQNRSRKKNPSDATGEQESEKRCNFTGTSDPSPILQCSCTSKILIASAATKSVYTDIKASQLFSIYNGLDNECLPVNMALWWTAMDIAREMSTFTSTTTVQLQRHGLALLYMYLDGWNNGSIKWLGQGDECEWEGIFCTTRQVTQINLNAFGLVGELPGSPFHFLPALIELALSDNTLHGSIPSEIWTLEALKVLDLSFNGFSNSISNEITKLKQLNHLILDHNLFTGSLPKSLYNLTLLTKVFLGVNVFTGTLSKNIAALSNLTTLSLSNNGFYGSLPSELGLLTQVSTIFVDHNYLTGIVPSELGLLSSSLQYLDAAFNPLTGTLPTELGSLTELYFFRLVNNQLTGTLSETLGNLSNLQTLILAHTMLTGITSGGTSSDQTLFSGAVSTSLCRIPELSLPCTVMCDCCRIWNETFPCQ